jgi:hypothetical protein
MPDPREEIIDALERLRQGIDRVFADHAARIAKLEERMAKLEDAEND